MPHLTDEILEQYEMGQLGLPAVDAVEEHLWFCERCRKRDFSVRKYLATIRAALLEAMRDVFVEPRHVFQLPRRK